MDDRNITQLLRYFSISGMIILGLSVHIFGPGSERFPSDRDLSDGFNRLVLRILRFRLIQIFVNLCFQIGFGSDQFSFKYFILITT